MDFCQESAGTGPAVLKVVPVTDAAILQVTMDQLICASLFPHPLLDEVGKLKEGTYGQHCQQSRDQPGGYGCRSCLHREKCFFLCPRSRLRICLARQVRLSCPAASAFSFSTPRLNLELTHGNPPAFCDGVHIYRQTPSGQSRVYRVTQLRTDGIHYREYTGPGPVVRKVVAATSTSFSGL